MSAIACKQLPRKFAPLGSVGTSAAPLLKGIVFDVDGTLWWVTLSFPNTLHNSCAVLLSVLLAILRTFWKAHIHILGAIFEIGAGMRIKASIWDSGGNIHFLFGKVCHMMPCAEPRSLKISTDDLGFFGLALHLLGNLLQVRPKSLRPGVWDVVVDWRMFHTLLFLHHMPLASKVLCFLAY